MTEPITEVSTEALPIVVIGAGPIGLAAAAHLVERGLEPLVLEAGDAAGAAVREWSHVRLFSTWAEVVDPAAEKLLAPTGWVSPDGATYPTGGDWAEHYLQPLADVLGDKVRFGARVTGVSRLGRDRVVDADREQQPFTVHNLGADGTEERITARAVIDASGTWATPSPIGGDGLPALGERTASDRISYRVPNLKAPAVRARYAGKRTAVIGSGASAFTALAYLADLAKDTPDTHAVWILRRGIGGSTFGGGEADQLPPAAHWASPPRPPSRTDTPTPSPASVPRQSSAMSTGGWCWWPRTDAAWTQSTRSSSSPASGPTSPSSPSCASVSTSASRPPSSWHR